LTQYATKITSSITIITASTCSSAAAITSWLQHGSIAQLNLLTFMKNVFFFYKKKRKLGEKIKKKEVINSKF
jgi:hypothetical protein